MRTYSNGHRSKRCPPINPLDGDACLSGVRSPVLSIQSRNARNLMPQPVQGTRGEGQIISGRGDFFRRRKKRGEIITDAERERSAQNFSLASLHSLSVQARNSFTSGGTRMSPSTFFERRGMEVGWVAGQDGWGCFPGPFPGRLGVVWFTLLWLVRDDVRAARMSGGAKWGGQGGIVRGERDTVSVGGCSNSNSHSFRWCVVYLKLLLFLNPW